ncbi:hypothetical protein HT136_25785 [Novosphingobium profundi]|uniref:hypothetical protein n=1 Tax=Novosphingobium profundi TaxID=1774954 RepID=UPI001BDA3CDE|nr:hypothetical protein [Novosphingobium profundi]MBT0671782.1 hypothetical protein [Novosphingobium profundi]
MVGNLPILIKIRERSLRQKIPLRSSTRAWMLGGAAIVGAALIAATLRPLFVPWDWGDEDLNDEW